MRFEAPLPQDFKELIDKFRHYLNYRKDHLEDDTETNEDASR